MSIDIGGMVTKIEQRKLTYLGGEPPTQQTMFVREVTFEQVGLPAGIVAPSFVVPVLDATKWSELKVGEVYTVSIAGGSIP